LPGMAWKMVGFSERMRCPRSLLLASEEMAEALELSSTCRTRSDSCEGMPVRGVSTGLGIRERKEGSSVMMRKNRMTGDAGRGTEWGRDRGGTKE
jgi:hypothetical protein